MSTVVRLKTPEVGEQRHNLPETGKVIAYPVYCHRERDKCQRLFKDLAGECQGFVSIRREAKACEPDETLKSLANFLASLRRITKKEKVQEDVLLCAVVGDLCRGAGELRYFLRHADLREQVYTYAIERFLLESVLGALKDMQASVDSLSAK